MSGCTGPVLVQTVYPDDLLMWNHINNAVPAMEFIAAPKGAIIPHHAITDRDVARFYKGLSKKINPKTIFIIGPNHYESGNHSIISADNCVFKTVYGDVLINKEIASKIEKEHIGIINNNVFIKEHSVYFHAPFIKKYFSNAKIVPIVITWKNEIVENERLARFLLKNITPDTFVIASVDFSHFQSKEAADFHDESSYATIKNFNFENIYDLEIDSPSSVYV
ncbi:MAG: AmmeMemoRadiSam system protein B, partial [bacterium]|nr:AmmeMemoRadiSam system protein B [bacterium]